MDSAQLPNKILLVDDEHAVAESVTGFLRKHNVKVIRAADLETALYQFNQQMFEVVVIELEFAPLPGLALAQKLRAHTNAERRQCGIVITSGQQRKTTDDGLMHELGDMELVGKPLSDVKLLPALARALQRRRGLGEYDEVRSVSYDLLKKTGDVHQAITHIKSHLPRLQMKGMALMAHLYEEAGQMQEALGIIDALLAKKPDDIAMLNAKGRLLLKSGRAAEARSFMEKADQLAPQNIDRVRAMAGMYLELEDPSASAAKMKELITLTPEEKDLKFDMFRNLEQAGHMDAAMGLCKETTLPTEVVRYYNNRGVLMSKSGENGNALHEYAMALRFYPQFKENFRIHFNVAIAEANQKTVDSLQRAEQSLQKCLEMAPNFAKASSLLSQVQRALLMLTKKSG